MNIYILYHIKERELAICEMIKEEILKQNKSVNVRIRNFHSIWEEIWDFLPNIILTIPPRDQQASNHLMLAKAALKCSIVSLLTEGFFYHKTDETWRVYIGTNSYDAKLVDYYLFWGRAAKDGQVKVLLEDKKITAIERAKIVGYVFYDKDNFKQYAKKIILPKIVQKWIDGYKRHILCLTGFPVADYTIEDFMLESAFAYKEDKSKKREYQLKIEVAKKSVQAFFDYREKYVSNIIKSAIQNPDIGYLIKLHPAEYARFYDGTNYQFYHVFDKYPNIYLLDEAVPMGVILPYTDLMIHYGSTAGLEAFLYKVPTMHLFMEEFSKESEMPGYCIYESSQEISMDDFEEFNKCIIQGVRFKKTETVEKILEEQFDLRDDAKDYHPAKKIAGYVLDSWNVRQFLDDNAELRKAAKSMEGYRSRKDIWKNKVKVLWRERNYLERDKYLEMLKTITPKWSLILYDILIAAKLTFHIS